jgi:hypothetical protein
MGKCEGEGGMAGARTRVGRGYTRAHPLTPPSTPICACATLMRTPPLLHLRRHRTHAPLRLNLHLHRGSRLRRCARLANSREAASPPPSPSVSLSPSRRASAAAGESPRRARATAAALQGSGAGAGPTRAREAGGRRWGIGSVQRARTQGTGGDAHLRASPPPRNAPSETINDTVPLSRRTRAHRRTGFSG